MVLPGHHSPQARMEADLTFIRQSAERIAAVAQQGYRQRGRGLVIIHHDTTYDPYIAYLDQQQIDQLGDLLAIDALMTHVETYDPLCEVLCLVLHTGDTAHVYRWKFQLASSEIVSWYQPPTA